MDAQCLPAPAQGGVGPGLVRAVELPFSLRLKPRDLRRLRTATYRRCAHLIPPGVDPRYEIDKMIDSMGPVTEQKLIKAAVDAKWSE